MSTDISRLEQLARLVRYYIIRSTTSAGSGHPTSSLSATDIMVGLFFGGFLKFDLDNPQKANNDRVIFSKGHASPLFYSLYTAAGAIEEEELMTMRKFGSRLEGHPMPVFPYTEAATGSLGQGLSIGAGMALNAKRFMTPPSPPLVRGGGVDDSSKEGDSGYRTYVLLGDSEMAEGSVWEAIQWAGHERLDNLVGIIDVNRLGQSGATMFGHDVGAFAERVKSFDWEVFVIDGHDMGEVVETYKKAMDVDGKPVMIVAKTLKGKGVSFLEDKEGWHGKTLSADDAQKALEELGKVDLDLRGEMKKPSAQFPISNFQFPIKSQIINSKLEYKIGEKIATRKAYGDALVRLVEERENVVVLDAEVKNSTFAESVLKKHPERFVEMFIAEQNMVGVAVGLARRGKVPFVSTFAAFFTRAFDQIRMGAYSDAFVKFAGSHAGVSIGEDGPSQMGLEDLAQFRTVQGSIVLYPSDAVSTERLAREAYKYEGVVYIRTTRSATTVIYDSEDKFSIGGSKTLRRSDSDKCTIISAGITLHEALAAADIMVEEGINVRVIDLYSVKPIDKQAILLAAKETGHIITVEDHVPEGGIGEAVASTVAGSGASLTQLAVTKRPKSGKPQELMEFEGIDKGAIIREVMKLESN